MSDETKDSLIGAGIQLGGALLGIAGKALAGLYQDPEKIRQEMLATVDDFMRFIAPGGEMDKRRDAARAKTDKAIEEAESKARALRAEEITRP